MSRALFKRQRGLTLIEIAVVLTIAAILLTQAAPLFGAWISNSQTRTAAEAIQNGLQLARAEAIRRNRMVQFSLTNAPDSSWTVGCANPVDNGTPNVEDAGDCLATIQTRFAAEGSDRSEIAIQPSTARTITFDSFGRLVLNVDGSPSATSIDVTNTSLASSEARVLRLTVGVGGQVRMCDPALPTSDPRHC